jgi:hypothetical protein
LAKGQTSAVHPLSKSYRIAYGSMEMSINIDQFPCVEKLGTLTDLYPELRLPLHDVLRAAEADLSSRLEIWGWLFSAVSPLRADQLNFFGGQQL